MGYVEARSLHSDPSFGHPDKFCYDPEQSNWMSATVTTLDEKILPYIKKICKRDPLSRQGSYRWYRDCERFRMAAVHGRSIVSRSSVISQRDQVSSMGIWICSPISPATYVKKTNAGLHR